MLSLVALSGASQIAGLLLFSPQDDDPTLQPSILDTALECIKVKVPPKIEVLDVVWYDDRIHVAGTFNRRLCVWRLLCLFRPDDFRYMKVRFIPESKRERAFRHSGGGSKYSTGCQGDWIEIRRRKFVGKQLQRDPRWDTDPHGDYCRFEPGVQWPEAHRCLRNA
jgi:hypothetical protein